MFCRKDFDTYRQATSAHDDQGRPLFRMRTTSPERLLPPTIRLLTHASFPNPLEQDGSWFIVRILRHKFASECFGENRLLEAIEVPSCLYVTSFDLFGQAEKLVNPTNNFFLLGQRWQSQGIGINLF
jgi:hypothetical protein